MGQRLQYILFGNPVLSQLCILAVNDSDSRRVPPFFVVSSYLSPSATQTTLTEGNPNKRQRAAVGFDTDDEDKFCQIYFNAPSRHVILASPTIEDVDENEGEDFTIPILHYSSTKLFPNATVLNSFPG